MALIFISVLIFQACSDIPSDKKQQIEAGSRKEIYAGLLRQFERAIRWKNTNNLEYCRMAFERALELLDLTIADPKNKERLKELLRLREMLSDFFVFGNEYHSEDRDWQNYFYSFNFSVRRML